ncbi:hypothetical protein [Candidatus Uabimicrobium sp. HlEnr_7]|uniref:hypothetical protein n=1 Tax=Candidatus Uabimicrobium helgolandensis TaxID=3095367 RepID=UPI0035571902
MKYIAILLISCMWTIPLLAQNDANVYAKNSYHRGVTAQKYKYNKQLREECKKLLKQGKADAAKKKLAEYFAGKVFLPTYDDMASSKKGVSLSDWNFHMLPRTLFDILNTDRSADTAEEKYLSKEELDEHPLMGTAVQQKQDRTALIRNLKETVENYKERLDHLKSLGYDISDETFYTNAENNSPDQVATKTYVNVKNGELVVQELPLNEYVNRLIRDQDDDNPVSLYLLGLVLICLTAAATFIISKFS